VRMLSPSGETLDVAVTAEKESGAWPADFRNNPVPLKEDHAATWAVKKEKTYLIEDTRARDIHLRPIPPKAGSHASIILKAGTQIIGVLSLDWERSRGFDAVLIRALETLSDRHATAIKSWGMDDLYRKIESFIKAGETQSEFDYQGFLSIVADMLGVHQGALFVRRPRTGRYHVAAHLTNPLFCNPDFSDLEQNSYGSGEGLTGWVAKNCVPLRLKDIEDASELRAIDPELKCSDRVFDGVTRKDRNNSYLGVPIAVGNEVMGVLRFATGSRGYFSAYDQQIALATASRLAGYLYEKAEKRRTQVLLQLSSRVPSADSQKDLASDIFKSLADGLEECACHIRVLDQFQKPDGEVTHVLRRLAVSQSAWGSAPQTRGIGEGIAGLVWNTGKKYVYQEVDKERWVREAMHEDLQKPLLLGEVGSGACVPLEANGKFIGTLHVHKRFSHALSPREIFFVEEVARLAGSALQATGKHEDEQLQLHLEDAVDDFLRSLLDQQPVRAHEMKLLTNVLKALQESFQAPFAWVWVLNEARTHFTALYAHGVSHDQIPNLPIESVVDGLQPSPFVVVSDWKDDHRLRPFADQHESLIGEIGEKTSAAVVLLMKGENEPRALFTLFVNSPGYGRAERAHSMLRPVSEKIRLGRRIEEHVRNIEVNEPLAFLGSMFSSLEHQFRTPIAALRNDIDFLRKKTRSEQELSQTLEGMSEAQEKLRLVLENTLLLGLTNKPLESFDLINCLEKTIKELQPKTELPKLIFHPPTNRLAIRGNANYLDIAFRFVIENALEAAIAVPDGRVDVRVSEPSGGSYTIVIEDNGKGMSPDELKKAITPYFTTKAEGSGLGLPTADCIIRSHHGQQSIDSIRNEGTRVTIRLPLDKGNN
jgi:GAF domain-containing protein/two-component sensor histidine kinase